MIDLQLTSESRRAFAYFKKVTSVSHFLRHSERNILYVALALYYFTLALIIWALHRFLHHPFHLKWLGCAFYGAFLSIPVFMLSRRVSSALIKKSLKDRGIIVSGGHWHGPEVQRLMLREFTDYLENKSLYNPEALRELIENTRYDIEARWRAMALSMTFLTLGVALYIGYYKTMFSQWLESSKPSSNEIVQLAVLGVGGALVLYQSYLLFSLLLSSARTQPVIYMQSLSDMRLLLLKQYNKLNTSSQVRIEVRVHRQ